MWQRRRGAGLLIRISGLVPLAIAALAARSLAADLGAAPGAMAYLLALVAFTGASAGCAMLFVGAHLFDRVEVSARWRRLS